ncbi:MAG: hypothetical protein GY856_38180 [bacterium]|nr:hypothetical protein [bacterium]
MTDGKHLTNETRGHEASKPDAEDRGRKKPKFEPPKVITYSGDDVLEELGPAHACSPFSGAVVDC